VKDKKERVWRLLVPTSFFQSTRNQLACVVCCVPFAARPTSFFFVLSACDNIPSKEENQKEKKKNLAAF
jgi:hypothetical protein